MSQNNIDVLIVGAGPVGLFCANELTRQGLTCRIIDKKSAISDKSKALGIHIRTLDVFEDCGFINDILSQGHQVDGALIKSKGKTLVDANFKGVTADRHFLIDLPQNQTEGILYQALQEKGIQVEWNAELTHLSQSRSEITATIKKPNNKIELFTVNWLIACDGSHSTVRHQVDAEFKGSAYKQTWWLADVLVDWQVSDKQMSIYLSNTGPLACFPMGDKRYRIVMTAPEGHVGEPTLEDIKQVFEHRSTDSATFSNPVWLTAFTIHHRQIQHYRYDRVFFAGDAAHIHSPMGGQGLNTGIQDIYNLAWKLALVIKNKANQELLNSYHEERFPIGQAVLKKTDIMTRMILLRSPFAISLRNAFIKFMTSFNKVKNILLTDLAELNISYTQSPIVHQSGTLKRLKSGQFLPDFQLLNQQTQQKEHRNSILQGTQHHLFIFSGNNPKKLTELIALANSMAERYPTSLKVHLVLGYPKDMGKEKFTVWLDEQAQVHQRFGMKKPTLLLIRPDKYIGILQNPIDKKDLLKQMYLV